MSKNATQISPADRDSAARAIELGIALAVYAEKIGRKNNARYFYADFVLQIQSAAIAAKIFREEQAALPFSFNNERRNWFETKSSRFNSMLRAMFSVFPEKPLPFLKLAEPSNFDQPGAVLFIPILDSDNFERFEIF